MLLTVLVTVIACPRSVPFTFRSREVQLLLSELDSYVGVDQLGFFPLFSREIASVLALKLSMVFRRLLRAELSISYSCCTDVVRTN